MATNFPGGIDTFVNPNATSSLDSPSHAGLHTDMGDAMTAVQTYLLNNAPILQVVRATDGTDRTTTSTSFVDVTGMSITITPQKNDSAILLIATFFATLADSGAYARFRITDSSNNAISGSADAQLGVGSGGTFMEAPLTIIGYATPATTNATTYKLRFRRSLGTGVIGLNNSIMTGQLYAIEVAA
jgi:hypothetical protein